MTILYKMLQNFFRKLKIKLNCCCKSKCEVDIDNTKNRRPYPLGSIAQPDEPINQNSG